MKLIYEIDSKPEFEITEELNEATGASSKKYKIKGVFSTIGEKNRNGRIYPRAIWESEVSKYQENFTNGSFNTLCEWEHPSRTNVDPMQAIAKIEKLYIKDNYVMGEAVLLDNEKANQLKTLIDNGIKLSVSSRGVGSVKNGIVENFQLITYDLVASPSDYSATMNGMVESYRLNEGILEDLSFTIDSRGHIVPMSESDCTNGCDMYKKEDIQEAAMQKFKEILESMKNSKTEVNESNIIKVIRDMAKMFVDKDRIYSSENKDKGFAQVSIIGDDINELEKIGQKIKKNSATKLIYKILKNEDDIVGEKYKLYITNIENTLISKNRIVKEF